MDRSTKLILAIIAIALVWIAFKDVGGISPAYAASGVIEVKVVEFNVSRYKPVPVEVTGEIKCKTQ